MNLHQLAVSSPRPRHRICRRAQKPCGSGGTARGADAPAHGTWLLPTFSALASSASKSGGAACFLLFLPMLSRAPDRSSCSEFVQFSKSKSTQSDHAAPGAHRRRASHHWPSLPAVTVHPLPANPATAAAPRRCQSSPGRGGALNMADMDEQQKQAVRWTCLKLPCVAAVCALMLACLCVSVCLSVCLSLSLCVFVCVCVCAGRR
jgi:hypothetical protein